MSYEYTSADGRRSLTVESAVTKPNNVFVSAGHKSYPMSGIWIANADIPTVAAELLKAAGQDSVIVGIPQVGEVTPSDAGWLRLDGDRYSEDEGATYWRDLVAHLEAALSKRVSTLAKTRAILAYIEGKASREAEAEKKLQERRDAIAKKAGHSIYMYAPQNIKTLIAQVVALEDATK